MQFYCRIYTQQYVRSHCEFILVALFAYTIFFILLLLLLVVFVCFNLLYFLYKSLHHFLSAEKFTPLLLHLSAQHSSIILLNLKLYYSMNFNEEILCLCVCCVQDGKPVGCEHKVMKLEIKCNLYSSHLMYYIKPWLKS